MPMPNNPPREVTVNHTDSDGWERIKWEARQWRKLYDIEDIDLEQYATILRQLREEQ